MDEQGLLFHLSEIGRRCRELRLASGVGIEELAAAINVDTSTLLLLEEGAAAAADAIPLAAVMRLADGLGADAGDLLAAPKGK